MQKTNASGTCLQGYMEREEALAGAPEVPAPTDEELEAMHADWQERNAKLTRHDVARIKADFQAENPPTVQSVAETYGVSATTIQAIKKGRNWKNVLPSPD